MVRTWILYSKKTYNNTFPSVSWQPFSEWLWPKCWQYANPCLYEPLRKSRVVQYGIELFFEMHEVKFSCFQNINIDFRCFQGLINMHSKWAFPESSTDALQQSLDYKYVISLTIMIPRQNSHANYLWLNLYQSMKGYGYFNYDGK